MDVNKEETTILFEICDDIQCASIFVCTGKYCIFTKRGTRSLKPLYYGFTQR